MGAAADPGASCGSGRSFARSRRTLPGSAASSICRGGRKTVSAQTGLIIETGAVALGGLLLTLGVRESSSAAAIAGVALSVLAFQPMIKVATGSALGVGYDYAYLAHGEPRFNMKYGSYLGQPRRARIVVHISGAVGSPLGAYSGAMLARDRLPVAYMVAMIAFWAINALNMVLLVAGVAGIKRLGVSRTVDTSCGAAGAEIRQALDRLISADEDFRWRRGCELRFQRIVTFKSSMVRK